MKRLLRLLTAPTTAAITVCSLVSCTADSNATGQIGSGSGFGQSDPLADQRRAGRTEGSVVLGDLNTPKSAQEVGAPFDPCSLPWEDFPEVVRPGTPQAPRAKTPRAGEVIDVLCVYETRPLVVDDKDHDAAGELLVEVFWGVALDADPDKHHGSVARSWNNRAGLVRRYDKQGDGCMGLVILPRGVAGTRVTNSRLAGVDACTVVDSVLTAVTAKAS